MSSRSPRRERAASRCSARKSAIATRTPLARSASAMPRPIPLAPPVTNATLSVRVFTPRTNRLWRTGPPIGLLSDGTSVRVVRDVAADGDPLLLGERLQVRGGATLAGAVARVASPTEGNGRFVVDRLVVDVDEPRGDS